MWNYSATVAIQGIFMRFDFKGQIDFEALKDKIPKLMSKFPNETIDIYTPNCVLVFQYSSTHVRFKFTRIHPKEDPNKKEIQEVINFSSDKYKNLPIADLFVDCDSFGYYEKFLFEKESTVDLLCLSLKTIEKINSHEFLM
jgi:hypothetical protein